MKNHSPNTHSRNATVKNPRGEGAPLCDDKEPHSNFEGEQFGDINDEVVSQSAFIVGSGTTSICADQLAETPITDMWLTYVADQCHLAPSTRTTLARVCRMVVNCTGKERLGDLYGWDVLAVADWLEESGKSRASRALVMKQVGTMLDTAWCDAGCAVLSVQLEECAGVAWEAHYAAQSPEPATPHAPAALNEEEIHRLMVELANPTTEALEPGLAEAAFWLIALALTSGVSVQRLAHACVADLHVSSDGRHASLRMPKASGSIRDAWVHPVVAGIGFSDYCWRMALQGRSQLFPALVPGGRGWVTLVRLLEARRFVDARGCGHGYSLADIETTYRCHADTLDCWAEGRFDRNDVVDALMEFASPVGFLM